MLLHAMNGERWRMSFALMLCCSLFVAALRCEAQNLVPNPSFELLDTCPYTIGFRPGDKPLDWEKWNQSPEYFHACAGELQDIDTLVDVPLNGWGFQYAWDGVAYVGMAAYDGNSDFREYVGCQLLEPLMVGQPYYLSFRANMAMGGTLWSPVWACNNIGLLFTMEPNIWTGLTGPPFALRNYAHLYDPVVNTDTAGWTLVSGTFIPDSAYAYLVIGNFFSDMLTDTIHVMGDDSLTPFFFVDAVCVTTTPEGCSFNTTIPDHQAVPSWWGPNPSNEEFEFRPACRENAWWQLFDPFGRIVDRGRTNGGSIKIQVGELPQGQYMVRTTGGCTAEHVKFVVLH